MPQLCRGKGLLCSYSVPIILKVIRKTSKKQISHGEAGGGSMKLKLSHNCLTSQLLQLNNLDTDDNRDNAAKFRPKN